jgi:hypothetical protein
MCAAYIANTMAGWLANNTNRKIHGLHSRQATVSYFLYLFVCKSISTLIRQSDKYGVLALFFERVHYIKTVVTQ